MDNFLLTTKTPELEQLSGALGFSRTLFLERDWVLIAANTPSTLLQQIKEAQKRKLLTVYAPPDEELLRFALEKTTVDIILNVEKIHAKDSLHYPRGGLDQVLCTIAAQNNKTVAFSFAEILISTRRSQLLRRLRFNLHLGHKYKIKMLFSTFARQEEELRSAADLQALWRLLQRK